MACLTSEFSHSTLTPDSNSLVLVIQVSFDMDIILASASPLKPIVLTLYKSSPVDILLVACFEKASIISSGCIPEPLSATLISLQSLSISMLTLEAPASTEFSTSSFTTEYGLSITSPAAIWFITFFDS